MVTKKTSYVKVEAKIRGFFLCIRQVCYSQRRLVPGLFLVEFCEGAVRSNDEGAHSLRAECDVNEPDLAFWVLAVTV